MADKNITIKEELERSEQICNKWLSDEENKILREEPINKADDALVALKLSLINTITTKENNMNDDENQNMCECETDEQQTFDFGKAIRLLKQGKKVARTNWGNDFVWLKASVSIKSEWCKDETLKALADKNGGEIEGLDTFSYYGEDVGNPFILTGWTPCTADILSDSWVLVEEATETQCNSEITE